MRKINREIVDAPTSLRTGAVREAKLELRRHYRLPPEQRLNRRAPFDLELLQAEDLVLALRRVFEDRCAYCESQIQTTVRGLDHFRPIASAANHFDKVSPDHYGWLAYDWHNLLVLCPSCQKAKRNQFPVEGPRAPLLCTWNEAVAAENNLLLNPCSDDPLRHFRILPDGRLFARTDTGSCTLEIVDLNRPALCEARGRVIQSILSALSQALDAGDPISEIVNRTLAPSAPHWGARLLLYRSIRDTFPETYRGSYSSSSDRFMKDVARLFDAVPLAIMQEAMRVYTSFLPDSFVDLGEIHSEAPERLLQIGDAPSSARITGIAVRNFKGIDDLTIEFSSEGESSRRAPCVMLVGENSTGKSSVLQAISLALMSPKQRARLGVEPEQFISRERASWQLIGDREPYVTVKLDSGAKIALHVQADPPNFVGEGVPGLTVLAYGARRLVKSSPHTIRKHSDGKTLFDPLATIPDPTRWLQLVSDDHFNAVARALREVLALQFDDSIFRDLLGNVLVKAHGRVTPIERMSDGYKSLFAVAVDVMWRMVETWGNLEDARGVVLIDEVETHLHPRWKMQVMTALRRAMPQVQFIATTHDPLCLRGMINGEVQVLVRDEDDAIFALEDLPNVQGLRADQLLTSDVFGLATTTDPKLEQLIEQYADEAGKTQSDGGSTRRQIINGIAADISDMTVLGDSVAKQIVAEAMTRYLAARVERPVRAVEYREDAVRAVIAVLTRTDLK
ncbi:AAA family ATPase [Variovorax sp. WS11]|nr:AAA family ATPase [Variovorax sp. WS11]